MKLETWNSRRAGVVLILASGLVVLVLLSALAVLGTVRLASLRGAHAAEAARASLAAEAGAEYTLARLSLDGYPRPPAEAASRGDDWTCRDWMGADVRRALNPSYAHGESWREVGGGPGRFDAGIDSFEAVLDADGDASFSAWSGRLRGGVSPRAVRFRLKIVSAGSRIPLNGGWLVPANADGTDNNGNALVDEPGEDRNETTRLDGIDNDADGQIDEADEATPDEKDLKFSYHLGLSHAISNLGAMVLPGGHPLLWTIPTSNPAEPVRYSKLGSALLSRRPVGGYRRSRQVADALLDAGCPAGSDGLPAGLAEILPYLDLGLPLASPQAGPPYSHSAAHLRTCIPAAPVELATAPKVVLAALLRYVGNGAVEKPWEAGASAVSDPRSAGATTYGNGRLLLFPEEADRIADALLTLRDEPALAGFSWNRLYKTLLDEAESAEPDLYAVPGADGRLFRSALLLSAPPYPVAHARYAQAKADIAFAALDPDPSLFPLHPPRAWSGWEIPRATGGGTSEPYRSLVPWAGLVRVALPAGGGAAYSAPAVPFTTGGDSIIPVPLSTRPPARLSVESFGESGRAAGGVLSAELSLSDDPPLSIGSQQDFENPALSGGFPELRRQGIADVVSDAVWADSPGDRRRRQIGIDDMGTPLDSSDDRVLRLLASFPAWDHGSYPPGAPAFSAYSRAYGALALSAKEAGPFEADLYFPLGETDLGIQAGAMDWGETPSGFPSESDPPGGVLKVDPPVPWNGSLNPGLASSFSSYPVFTPYFLSSTVSGPTLAGLRFPEEIPPAPPPNPDLPEGFPAMRRGQPLGPLTIEGWLDGSSATASASIAVTRDNQTNSQIRITAAAAGGTASRTRVSCSARNWLLHPVPDSGQIPIMPAGGVTLASADVDDLRPGFASHHVAVVFVPYEGSVSTSTEVRLYVDGILRDAQTQVWVTNDYFALDGNFHERLHLCRADEVRVYRRALRNVAEGGPFDEVKRRFEAGRLVKRGAYISPLYVLDGRTELRHCQWTGMIPDLRDAFGNPIPSLVTVKVRGYWDANGASLADEATLGPTGRVHELAALGMPAGLRSFRFAVDFDATAAADPLFDTPVFDGIWISYRREGASRRWGSWTR